MEHAVLVTGASSGIGAATAQALAREGRTVFAGVRSESDARAIAGVSPNIRALHLDVTDRAQIAEAFDQIRASGMTIDALINNAGIAMGGPLEYLPLDDIRKQFDVNVFGTLAVTQAALPMLRETRGRIIMIGSIAGRLAAPFIGPYSASKAALASLADSLRIELASAGIAVSLFEFAAVKTPIWAKGRALKDDLVTRLPHEAIERYAPVIDAIVRQTEHEERVGMDPAIVAGVIAQALRAPYPRARYVVGSQAKMQAVVAFLPHKTRDGLIRRAMRLP